ncbi:hypothetical protein LEP1GSC036_2278 [Leptospira weilii str. 2006001853]|uniref:Uncharacterized protein n=2 Tax=Leptospira weilii TaxID=28184 RepID=A0A828Z501_9LEPT|nr:hypothetical protein LEP1GSC036_2278 [Leptospira weilii str. 2006001853]EMM71122.1 hypothetical protein LEP1GSC038_0655 [Leptospira weilii str. 2006001855]EMN45121.1 hypothetical protein LEP1GSC086_2847 [Leptospira weilii str. LNT 1234]
MFTLKKEIIYFYFFILCNLEFFLFFSTEWEEFDFREIHFP